MQVSGLILNSIDQSLSVLGSKHVMAVCKIKEFLRVLASICPAVSYGWVYTKTMEKEKISWYENLKYYLLFLASWGW